MWTDARQPRTHSFNTRCCSSCCCCIQNCNRRCCCCCCTHSCDISCCSCRAGSCSVVVAARCCSCCCCCKVLKLPRRRPSGQWARQQISVQMLAQRKRSRKPRKRSRKPRRKRKSTEARAKRLHKIMWGSSRSRFVLDAVCPLSLVDRSTKLPRTG